MPPVVGYVVKTSTDKPARIAVVVGRKVSPSAVMRHRIQRQFRHGVASYLTQYPVGYDMVLVVQPAAKQGVTPQQVQEVYGSIYNQLQSSIG